MENKVNKCGVRLVLANGLIAANMKKAGSETVVSFCLNRVWALPALANVEFIEDLEVHLEQGR